VPGVAAYAETTQHMSERRPPVRSASADQPEADAVGTALAGEPTDSAHALLDSLEDAYFELDLAGHLVDFNRALCEITGSLPEELTGLSYQQYTDPDTAQRLFQVFNQVYRTGEPVKRLGFELQQRNGTRRTVEISVSLIRDAAQQPCGFRGVLRDVSERARTEQALQASEQQYRTLLAAAERQMRERDLLDQVRALLARELDLQTVLKTVVEAAAQTFGYTHVSLYLLERTVLVLQHQVGYVETIQQIPISAGVSGRVLRTGQPVWLPDARSDPAFLGNPEQIKSEVCVPILAREQVIGTFNIEGTDEMSLSDADLRIALALAQHIGVALERARLVGSLRESEERYRRIIETAQEGIWMIDAQASTTYVNPKLAELLGYSVEQMIGRAVWAFMDEADKPLAAANLERRRQGIAEQHDFKFLHENGKAVWVILNATPLFDPGGKYEGVLATVTDISERKRTEEATLRRNAELAALNQLAQALSKLAEPAALLELIYQVISPVLDNRNLYIALYDAAKQTVSFPVYSMEGRRIPWPGRRLSNGLTEHIIRTRAPLLLTRNLMASARALGITPGRELRSYLGVPMLAGDRVVGVIAMRDHEREDAFDLGHQEMLSTIASQSAIALENARLFAETERLARTDALTGIANRRTLFEAGARELSRARRFGHPLSALMLDIDQFKQVNDTYGHARGDEVLHVLAQRCQQHIRESDLVARYGGEEFVILLVETELRGARSLAERLRDLLAQTVSDTGEGPLQVTVSIGVAATNGETVDFAALLQRADEALYAAKQAGGNRVEVQQS